MPKSDALTSNDILQRLAVLVDTRKTSAPEQSYIARLFHQGDDAILKKIGEEATEVVMAAKDVRHGDAPAKLIGEVADLWFHCLVMLAHFELSPAAVLAELERREGISGLDEKALRKALARAENDA